MKQKISITIDENEVHNLRKICEEVFGIQNYAGEIIWKNSSKNDQSYISMQHEYIWLYSNGIRLLPIKTLLSTTIEP